MATFIPADENIPVREVKPANGTDFQLTELYTLLNCDMIDIMHVSATYRMVLDDEGRFAKKPRNERATALAGFVTPKQMVTALLRMREAGVNVLWMGEPLTDLSVEVDCIVGDVLVCREDELR